MISYIRRSLEPTLERAVREFPVVVLTGPRQSGKTTLLKHLFGRRYRYVSLEAPDVRHAAGVDPRGFLSLCPSPVIFDEVQHVPELLSYIKEQVDERRRTPGQYLLTGSQNLLLLERVTQSLAGRAAMLRLLPLSQREIDGRPDAPLPWEARRRPVRPVLGYAYLWKRLLRGGYPEIVANPDRDALLWHSSYVQTYLERDVRSLRRIEDMTLFQGFVRALAARSAQLLNMADLARDLGVALNSVRTWLSVLEATFLIVILRPYFANIGKRLVKMPKVYFTDVGTLCYLVGLRDPEHAAAGPMAGAIFETAVLSEIMKAHVHRGEEPQVYFWRTSTGVEVDFVVERGGRLIPIEAKCSATARPAMAEPIRAFRADLGDRAAPGYVVYPGEAVLPLGNGTIALPFAGL